MNKLLTLTLAVVLLLSAAPLRAAEPGKPIQDIFKNLMAATVSNNYDGFVAECDDTMKAAIPAPKLASVSQQIAPRAQDGYDSDYLGELSQHGFAVHLWRLRFKSGGDDILATVSIKDGKVGGFYLH